VNPVGDAIRLEGLEKSFGDWPVLWDLDLTLGWGQFLVIFGANGVGKSTLLRILSTQARADAGKALIAGYDLQRNPQAVRSRVGVVAHQTFLYDDLTALENLVYYGRLFGLNDPEQKADEALSKLGMDRRSGQRLRSLSHGMQKRVAIARAIMHRPSILLLDEPESGLDRGSVELLRELLQEWAASGRAVVMTTHDTELGFSWTGQQGLLAEGKLHLRGLEGTGDSAEFPRRVTESLGASR
jgi:heme exporter protein A